MKKYSGICIAGLLIMTMLTGCGSNNVELGEYKGLPADKVIVQVTDEEVKEAVDDLLYDYITYDPITGRAAENGDNVNVDYVISKLDGEKYVPDQDDEGYDPYSGYAEDIVIGEEYVYPEVEKALIGMKTGEKKTVTAKLTDDFVDDDMVGKTAELEVTLNEILEEKIPEYNDDFIKTNTDYETIAEYEEGLREELKEEKEESYKYETVADLIQIVIDNSKFNGYSNELYETCEEEYNSTNEQMAQMYGLEIADYEEFMGVDEDSKKEEIIAMVHEHQVVEAIASNEGLKVTDDEVKEFVDGMYEDYEYESADDFIKDYGMDYLKYYLLYDKVSDFLYDNAKLNEITEDEYNEKFDEEYNVEDADDEDVDVEDDEIDVDID